MNEKHYESHKILNSYMGGKERLIARYGEKPMTGKEKFNYAVAISADLINSFLAFMMLLDGNLPASIGLAGIFAYMVGWWVPGRAGTWLKDGQTRDLPYLISRGKLLVLAALVSIAGITVIRLLNLEATGTGLEMAGFSEDIAMGTASAALAIVLTCIMLITFLISFTSAQEKRNYYREKYLVSALALIHEREENAKYHATVSEMEDEDNAPALIMEEARAQLEAVLAQIREMAAILKAQARAELEIHLADPGKTTAVMSSKVK